MQKLSHYCQSSQASPEKEQILPRWMEPYFHHSARTTHMHDQHQTGHCGYRHVLWDEDSRTRNITVLITRRKAIVDRFTFETEKAKEEIMSWMGTPPEFWLNSETQDRGALLAKLCEDIIHIQETIKGRKKAEFRRLISSGAQLPARKDRGGNQVRKWKDCEHI